MVRNVASIALAGLMTFLASGHGLSEAQAARRPAPPSKKPVERKVESIPGQFVVQLKSEPSMFNIQSLEHSLGARVIEQVRSDMVLIQRDPQEVEATAIKTLLANPAVLLADANVIYHASRVPNDPDFKKTWGLKNTGELDAEGLRGMKGVDVGTERAWDITTGSKQVVVAVIDTGVDFSIPDLTDNQWINLVEKNGKPGIDDDSNGYVDDINGYDFANNKGDSKDDNGHGSHVAGTIGARGDDGAGVAGVNWNVSIMAVKFLDKDGAGSLANAIKGIEYARKMGAKIMNNSWGGGGVEPTLLKAIEGTRDSGILFVAAAGNDGTDNDAYPSYPASYPVANIISVAAIDNRGGLPYFSNYGAKTVHVAAPGVNIYSTVPGGFDTYSGTSMATPHVAGVAALLLAHEPNLTYADLKSRILTFARPLKSLQGKVSTGGVIDAYDAMTSTTPPPDANDPSLWTHTVPYQLASKHPYDNKSKVSFTVNVPGAKRLSLHFGKFETEAGFDKIEFLTPNGESLGFMSGILTGGYSPVADGDTLILKFVSDDSVNGFGFEANEVSYEPAP